MAHLIDKDALLAEIDKAIDEPAPSHDQQCEWEDGYYGGLYKAESIIDTLEVKEGGISTPNIDDILKEEGLDPYSKEAKIFKEVYYTALDRFINTVDVKEENCIWKIARTTVPEGSTNQIICIKEDGLAVTTIGKIVNGTVKWAYLDDLLNTNNFNVEMKEADLEKELTYEDYKSFFEKHPELLDDWGFDECWVFATYFYKLGLKAQKGE